MSTNNTIKRIGILTGGGDCPGLNAVIRAVTKTAIFEYDLEVVGIEDGFLGLVEDRAHPIDEKNVSGILTAGGTILGSNNKCNPRRYAEVQDDGSIKFVDVMDRCMATIKKHGIEALIVIGGDGTMACAKNFVDMGINCIGVPKTIDNDLAATIMTFGFETAVSTAVDALDRLRSTAESHDRVMVLEVMGRYAGWIAGFAGLAGGADVILIPEIPFDYDAIRRKIQAREAMGKEYTLVVVAEGAKPRGGQFVTTGETDGDREARLGGIGHVVAAEIEKRTGKESRCVVLGHLQRGGQPSQWDRQLCTRFGVHAVEMIAAGQFGMMVALTGHGMEPVKLTDAIANIRRVPVDGELVQTARALGVSLGDE